MSTRPRRARDQSGSSAKAAERAAAPLQANEQWGMGRQQLPLQRVGRTHRKGLDRVEYLRCELVQATRIFKSTARTDRSSSEASSRLSTCNVATQKSSEPTGWRRSSASTRPSRTGKQPTPSPRRHQSPSVRSSRREHETSTRRSVSLRCPHQRALGVKALGQRADLSTDLRGARQERQQINGRLWSLDTERAALTQPRHATRNGRQPKRARA